MKIVETTAEPDKWTFRSIVRDSAFVAADYLQRHVDERGWFNYKFDPARGSVLAKYNIVRHAGCAYAMWTMVRRCHVYREINGLESGAQRATVALVSLIEVLPKRGAAIASEDTCKLGATALALLSLIERGTYLGNGLDSDVEALSAFVLSLLGPSGRFGYGTTKSGIDIDRSNPYFSGEAAFALARSAVVYRNAQHEAAAFRSLDFLQSSLLVSSREELDLQHWTARAMAVLALESNGRWLPLCSEIVSAILDRLERVPVSSGLWSCGALATKVEALCACGRYFLQLGHADRAQRALEVALGLLPTLMSFQYRHSEAARGGFAFSRLRPVIRIDTVQHALSALIDIDELDLELNVITK